MSVGPFPLGSVLGILDRGQPLWVFFSFFSSLPLTEKRKRSQGMPRGTQELELTSQNHSAAPKWVSLQAALCYSSPTQHPHSGGMMEPDARSRACRKSLPEEGKPGHQAGRAAYHLSARVLGTGILRAWGEETHCQWHPAQGRGVSCDRRRGGGHTDMPGGGSCATSLLEDRGG